MPEPTDVRKRLIIIAGILAGVLLALFLFIAVLRDKKEPSNPEEDVPAGTTTTGATPSQATPPPASTPGATQPTNGDPEDVYLKQLARIFVERFGSYSNQNDNRHITDVLSLATERMQAYLESQALESARVYAGVTTKVVASRITEKSGNTAIVAVDVQRVIREDGTERSEYASGTVTLKKVSGEWKVDGLFWERLKNLESSN